jgi:hypothetical protein
VIPPAWWPTIPGYEILGELGRGGMGVVYKAKQTKADRVVALKMILSNRPAGLHDHIRFKIEAEAVARLQHPNIVQLHDVGELQSGGDTLPFFSLEFVEGGGLDKKLKGEPLPATDAAALAEKLARAMHYAHSRGVIHRDLKPANVLLAFSREHSASAAPTVVEGLRLSDAEPKVADFGLAKRLDSDSDVSHTGAVLGTPTYMAPEQAEGRGKDVGPASDIYALGVILYETLTGRPPFRGDSVHAVLEQVLRKDPPPLRQVQPRVPVDLETICLKCLQKDPARRYATAADLAEDLRRFLHHEPIRARPVGWAERLAKWVKRRPALAALTGVSALAAFAVLGLSLWYNGKLSSANTSLAQERDEAHRQRELAEKAEKGERHARELAEKALAQNRERAALSALAYAHVCGLASRLATRSWDGAGDVRAEFRTYADLLDKVSDPSVKEALEAVNAVLEAPDANGPTPELRRLSLQLAHACRTAWDTTSRQDFPEAADELRKSIYRRACTVARNYANAQKPEDQVRLRNAFWELYWGEMAVVESKAVEEVMVEIGKYIPHGAGGVVPEDAPKELKRLAAKLTRECKLDH